MQYSKKHKEAANSDLKIVLNHKHHSNTSKFLKDAEYVKRKGKGINARWYLG